VLDGLADPFETAALRERVLTAWAASPARFREDANAEDDYALGGYRDRVVVELAQNAADAAARAGVPGRLRLTLRDGTLEAANTGASLDATGVEALATLRASGKRGAGAPEGTVGRFGVGFAAVVAVSEAPRICSVTGGVRWSRTLTRDLVGQIPSLAAELAVRSEHVPVLRLPFPDDGVPPDGYATAVTLPLRDADAARLVERLLAETGPALLLALPVLAEVSITIGDRTRVLTAEHHGDEVTITEDGVPSRWRTSLFDGLADPALLADRPAEERHGSGPVRWYVRWAVPVTRPVVGELDVPTGRLPAGVGAVVHAPTPTDEPLGLPALLLASFPLGSDRRHVAPGPLTEFLTERAAQAYARLLPALALAQGCWTWSPVPSRGVKSTRGCAPRSPRCSPRSHSCPPRKCRRRGSDRRTRSCSRPLAPGWSTSSPRCSPASSAGRRAIRPTSGWGCGGCRSPNSPTRWLRSTVPRRGGGCCTTPWPRRTRAR
jgi:hypothetical protein